MYQNTKICLAPGLAQNHRSALGISLTVFESEILKSLRETTEVIRGSEEEIEETELVGREREGEMNNHRKRVMNGRNGQGGVRKIRGTGPQQGLHTSPRGGRCTVFHARLKCKLGSQKMLQA